MKIAVIDQGIDQDHPKLKKCQFQGVLIQKTQSDKFTIESENEFDDTGHGTAIAGIIHKINPDNIIYSVHMRSFDEIIGEDLVCKAIEFSIQKVKPDIINLSLGIATDNPSQKLIELCQMAYEKEICIVSSAYPNINQSCFPAFFPNVFGVGNGLTKNKMDYGFQSNHPINILAYGGIQRVLWKDDKFRITAGTSYAAARFTGILSLLLQKSKQKSVKNIFTLVKENQSNDVTFFKYRKNLDDFLFNRTNKFTPDIPAEIYFNCQNKLKNSNKIALFPYTEKENSTILKFKELSKFQITTLIDYPKKIGNKLYNVDTTDLYVINRSLSNEDYLKFDTLVVGYFLEQDFDANILFGIQLIKECLRRNKNFIVWDRSVYNLILEEIRNSEHTFSGDVFYEGVDDIKYNKTTSYLPLPKVKVPILAVVGTGSQQGKVTVQLKVKKILQDTGYVVSHFATEPQSVIFGAEMLFPYGFNSPVEIFNDKWGKYIDSSLRGIQEAINPDIIISGTQGGMIPRCVDLLDTTSFILSSLNFITGLKPDAIICTINPTDEIQLIEKTINTLKTFTNAKVIFLCMTPWRRRFIKSLKGSMLANFDIMTNVDVIERMKYYHQKLNIPVINILDENKKEFILESIQNAFSN